MIMMRRTLKLPLPKWRSTTHPNIIFYTFLLMEISFGCSVGVQSTQIKQTPPPTQCDQQQINSYRKSAAQLSEYVDTFISEISKFSSRQENFQLAIRRSQVMIAFGEDLIKRLGILESILNCEPLHDQYLADRQMIFNKLEGLIRSQSAP